MSPGLESRIEYPADFPIKVFGRTAPGFAQAVLSVVHEHAPDFDATSMEMRTSRGGRYLSVTCVVRATSREQLDELYQALCDHPLVIMVL
jgi:uncharacterized protein